MEDYRNSNWLRLEHHQWVAAAMEGGFGWDNAFVDAGVGDRGKLGAKE